MTKTSLWQKAGLILFGLFLTLFVLEIGLRAGGFLLSCLQEHRNRLALRQRGAYRIMCIGESTTQGQYPQFLEEFLNTPGIGIKFSVTDKGMGGTDTSFILARLEENIEKYHPDMVVAMLGINDNATHMPEGFNSSSPTPLRSLKVYKLLQLLSLHIKHKIQESVSAKVGGAVNIPSGKRDTPYHDFTGKINFQQVSAAEEDKRIGKEPGIFYMGYGMRLKFQGDIPSAKEAFRKAIEVNPYNFNAYANLAWLFKTSEQAEVFRQGLQSLKKLLETNNISDAQKSNARAFCLTMVCQNMCVEELEGTLKKLLSIDVRDYSTHITLGDFYLKERRYREAEQSFKNAIALDASNYMAFARLASLYHETGELDLNKHYLRKVDELRPVHYQQRTINNYHEIKRILDKHKIKLACVQYPLRKLEDLRQIFAGQDDDIIFVNNESLFKDALQILAYRDLFSDMFAGDFGHCTYAGNRLLARNIAKTILEKTFGKRQPGITPEMPEVFSSN